MANFVALYCIRCTFKPKCIFLTAQWSDIVIFWYWSALAGANLGLTINVVNIVWLILTVALYVPLVFGIYNLCKSCGAAFGVVGYHINFYLKVRIVGLAVMLAIGYAISLVFYFTDPLLGFYYAVGLAGLSTITFIWAHGYTCSFMEAFGLNGTVCSFGTPFVVKIQQSQMVSR
jgi:hypothetical protein